MFGLYPGLITGIAITALLLLRRRLRIKNKIRKAEYIYEYGDQQTLRFEGISNRLFQLPQDTTPVKPGRVLRNTLVILVPLAFVFGLTWFITSEMKAHSSTYAQPDALLYRQNGRLVMASVFTHFQANQIKNGTTYGSDNYYAEAIDVETGKKLWKFDLESKDNRGSASLLGQSPKYLFFLRNDLFIVDKETGALAATDLKTIKDKLSREPVGNYMEDAAYKYSDSLQALVIKGNDGLFYTIDGNTLHTGAIDIADPNDYFKNKYKIGNNYADQIASLSDDSRHCLALLDTKDTFLLAHDANTLESRPARESIRRQLYSTPSMTNDSSWTKLDSAVFLFGGFLIETGQSVQHATDSLSRYTAYQDLASRYNNADAPLRTRDSGYVILHKTTIEPDAALLLTGISPTGQTRGHYSTGFLSIPLMHHDTGSNTLYIAGNSRGDNGDNLTQLIAIDLATGAIKQYSLN